MENEAVGAIERVLQSSRRKLLETGTRNRLIHVNRTNQRSNCLNIINERSEDVFGILNGGTSKMRFKAMGKDRKAGTDDDLLLAAPDDTLELGSDRYTDQILETPLGPEALARRLLRLFSASKTAEEEQGLNILYLALGFLQWRESETSEVTREAPLLLLPVELVRNEKTSTFDIRLRDDDMSTNLPLRERLMQDFGITLPEVEDTDELTPEAYFDAVQEVVLAKDSWVIDRDGIQLGFFSFAKLLMHRDLDPEAWTDGAFEENKLLNGLLKSGFDAEDPLFGPEDRLDERLDPAEIIQVVDADASQTKVIEEVRRGASLVVQGPPGTGKSQTIANIIAGAVHDGKTVLFVAEKMAALSVVHDRLVKVGLRDICLELHSRTANKKAVALELARTLAASATMRQATADSSPLRQERDELNRLSSLLHDPCGQSGDSPFSTMAEIVGFIGENVSPPRITSASLATLGAEARAQSLDAIARFVTACKAVAAPDRHPFRATTKLDLQPIDLERLTLELGEAIAAIEEWRTDADAVAPQVHQPAPVTLSDAERLARTVRAVGNAPTDARTHLPIVFAQASTPRLADALGRGNAWQTARQEAEGSFASSAWGASTAQMRMGLMRGQTSFFGRLFGPYRRCSQDLAGLLKVGLPKPPAERLALIDQLEDVQGKRRKLAEDEHWLQANLGEAWRGESTDFSALSRVCDWLNEVQRNATFHSADDLQDAVANASDPGGVADRAMQLVKRVQSTAAIVFDRLGIDVAQSGLGTDIVDAPVMDICDRLLSMQRNPGGYAEWATLERTASLAEEAGADAIVTAVRDGTLPPNTAATEFRYACAEARWADMRASKPDLHGIANKDRHALVRAFQARDKARLSDAKEDVLARHFEQIPRGSAGEMAVIRGEIGRKRGHKSVRWVMSKAGNMVQRIKPVMLMSPLSVAQFLPPSSITFDLLIIDEASQVRPEDSLGVIARARQIVVVGDTQQLPPTNFFSRLVEDVEDEVEDDEDALVGASAADMESVLSLCEARGLKPKMLEWHYRSKDPSLIRVSNAEFYEDRLVLPPSPLQLDDNYGLKFRKVPGVYAAANSGLGRAGTNRIEAEAVVAAMAAHGRDWPKLSLGVVAFSKAQATMITEVLEAERRNDPVLDALLKPDKSEDVFVKNIENVQGDERDVIFVSVARGPSVPNGRLSSMSFGPVNSEGGERRLNVLFSRSRVRCEIFASFEPGDIDLGRTQKEGPRVLKRFLEFAKTGVIEERSPTGLGADSPFEEDVAREVRRLGYLADYQVGSSGFRIDLGIRHEDQPGQYFLAVECDGATYHSALWARERDRLRQEVLEHLGWRFHRIWSTDWFNRREQEIAKLAQTLADAKHQAEGGIRVEGANEHAPVVEIVPAVADQPDQIDIDAVQITVPAYVRASLRVQSSIEPHLVPLPRLAGIITQIVEIEGPIHLDEVARRLATAFGKQKAGRRINEVARLAFNHAKATQTTLHRAGDFVMTTEQSANCPVRDRSLEADGVVNAAYLPPTEIIAAAKLIQTESGVMERDELVKTITRVLGFKRAGPKMFAYIQQMLANADHQN
jgi:hypothetical protein